ncbi:GNAT family N-acetyltransferase [Nocardioides sp. GY 10113]|uniref:GNAT family N-acetyltransferase n=1 Tax=Nocardioides sp. GY 10113 TaxID=2569761 RepID=UPI0010A78BE3|nr:GNAT family N-acetyltransferase [Nocardioides sp. GY 10113]TIC88714.1 GNAT family N-acetyltransferase [Nocardioides sp. GY 10113]
MVVADVSVRVAWPADAAGIAGIQLRSWQRRYASAAGQFGSEVAAELEEAWRTSLARPPAARHRALVALEAERVVGFALTVPATDPDSEDAADGEVAEFTVDPDRLGHGHGSRLLQACVDTLVADRFQRALCWVDSTDDGLRAFLSGAGWAADGASRELAGEHGSGSVRQVRLHCSIG